MVYVREGLNDQPIVKYDPVKNEWSTLPPPPVVGFGVGQLNGRLVIVGGMYTEEGLGVTGDIHVFEEETQHWVKSVPPTPSRQVFTAVVYMSRLLPCGVWWEII